VRVCRETDPDVVLMDLMLPGRAQRRPGHMLVVRTLRCSPRHRLQMLLRTCRTRVATPAFGGSTTSPSAPQGPRTRGRADTANRRSTKPPKQGMGTHGTTIPVAVVQAGLRTHRHDRPRRRRLNRPTDAYATTVPVAVDRAGHRPLGTLPTTDSVERSCAGPAAGWRSRRSRSYCSRRGQPVSPSPLNGAGLGTGVHVDPVTAE
jgi:hypothetical protein